MEMENENKWFELVKWNAVAVWSWETEIENCAICKLNLSNCCPICVSNSLEEKNNCLPIWGMCNHPFHHHCINKWLETKKTCPLCQSKWEDQKEKI